MLTKEKLSGKGVQRETMRHVKVNVSFERKFAVLCSNSIFFLAFDYSLITGLSSLRSLNLRTEHARIF